MRRKKNKQMEGQMSIFDMFSSVIENTKTEEENVTVSEGGIAAADITAVETGTQTSIFDLFSTDDIDDKYLNDFVGDYTVFDLMILDANTYIAQLNFSYFILRTWKSKYHCKEVKYSLEEKGLL